MIFTHFGPAHAMVFVVVLLLVTLYVVLRRED